MASEQVIVRRLRMCLTIFLMSLGCVLAYTGMVKVFEPDEFRAALRGQGLLPDGLVRAAVWAVPGIEIVCASAGIAFLASGPRLSRACVALGIPFFLFTWYAIGLEMAPPPKPVGCGCGLGNETVRSWGGLALRNAGITTALTIVSLRFRCAHPDSRSFER